MRAIFKVYVFLSAIIFCVHYTYAQPGYLLHQPYAVQSNGTDSIYDKLRIADAATAISRSEELINWTKDKSDEQLYYLARLIRVKLLMTKGVPDDHKCRAELSELAKTINISTPELKAEILNLYGFYLLRSNNTSSAGFEYAFNAYDIYKDIPAVQLPKKSMFLYELGINYTRFKDYAGAKQIFKEALQATPNYKEPGEHNLLNALGMAYRNTGSYDSAEYYFRRAYNIVAQKNDSVWIGILLGNIGITYYLQRRYTEAIPLLEQDIKMGIDRKIIANTAKSMAILGDICLVQGNKRKGMELLLQSYDLIKKADKWRDYELTNIVYPILAKAYAQNGNAGLAYAFMDSAIAVKDSIALQRNSLILTRAKQKLDAQKFTDELQRSKAQKRINTLVRNGLITFILLASMIVLLFINRQKIRHKRKQEKLETEKRLSDAARQLAEIENQRSKNELLTAAAQLKDFTRSMREKNELIEKFTEEIERYRSLPCSNELLNQNEALLQLQQSTILTEEQWDDFRNMFEKVHSGYLNRLRDKLSGLSPSETRFITLSKLKFSNKEMAGVLGISTDAVRMNKHRLKKKLNLLEDEELDNLIDTI